MKTLAPAVIAEIHRMLRETPATYADISAALDIGMRSVARHAADVPRDERFRPSPYAISRDLIAKINDRLINTTDSYMDIARSLGTTDSTVRHYASLLEPGSFPSRKPNNERIPAEVVAKAIQWAIEGMHPSEIAGLTGIHVKSVQHIIRRNRVEIDAAKAERAPEPAHDVSVVESFEDRLRADGWDEVFIADAVRNFPHLAVSMQVSA